MNTPLTTRPLFTVPPGSARVLKLLFIVAILWFIYPTIITLGWHLFHGNTIETRGKKVFVPPAWIADTDSAMNVGMSKLPLTMLHGLTWNGLISVGQNFWPPHAKTEEIYSSWEAVHWNMADAGAVVTGPVRTGSGVNETFCMESAYPKAPQLVFASCLVLQGKWRADFRGDKRDLKTFLKIIQKMN